MRLGRALHCEVRPSDVRPEELLLPRHAEGLPGLPVRPADQRRRSPRSPRRESCGHRAGPHRGGHREVHPRRWRQRHDEGPHPRRRLFAGGLQPLRRAPRRDRVTPRPPHLRAGPRLRVRAAGRPGRHRRLRRQDGGGVDAGRRQRVRPPARRRRSAPAARSRTSTRCAPSAAPSTTRPAARSTCSNPASGSSSRPATGTRTTAAPTPCAPRRRPRTTGTSRSRTSCRSSRNRTSSPPSTLRCRPCRLIDAPGWPTPPASPCPTRRSRSSSTAASTRSPSGPSRPAPTRVGR